VRSGLSPIDPYFVKLADGMAAWVRCWNELNPPAALTVAAKPDGGAP
jgi:reversibly glycosylated polypeptide / UDP-arabinopyranose mutase